MSLNNKGKEIRNAVKNLVESKNYDNNVKISIITKSILNNTNNYNNNTLDFLSNIIKKLKNKEKNQIKINREENGNTNIESITSNNENNFKTKLQKRRIYLANNNNNNNNNNKNSQPLNLHKLGNLPERKIYKEQTITPNLRFKKMNISKLQEALGKTQLKKVNLTKTIQAPHSAFSSSMLNRARAAEDSKKLNNNSNSNSNWN
jgi:hypothetical protein